MLGSTNLKRLFYLDLFHQLEFFQIKKIIELMIQRFEQVIMKESIIESGFKMI